MEKIWEKIPLNVADEDLADHPAAMVVMMQKFRSVRQQILSFCIDYAEAFFTLQDHMLDPASIEEKRTGDNQRFCP